MDLRFRVVSLPEMADQLPQRLSWFMFVFYRNDVLDELDIFSQEGLKEWFETTLFRQIVKLFHAGLRSSTEGIL